MNEMKIMKKNMAIKPLNSALWDLPSPTSMNYFWNMGASLGIILVVQMLTGILLTMHYTSYASESFQSVVEIMKETWWGWLIRFLHMNGASLFFGTIYIHMARGLYFMSYKNQMVWNSGVTILIILMAISFMGYVLPWGQMSYWAVAVITNLFSVVPLMGETLVKWIWGGFNVSSPTLTRFYSLHFLLPFILSLAVITHLVTLHSMGSSNPLGLPSNSDKMQFHPYFTTKDILFIMTMFAMSTSMSMFKPYLLGDPVNMMPANPMQTPIHIQPEWYFLTSYAILRAMPSKISGVIALAISIAMFYVLPKMMSKYSAKFNMYRNMNYWLFLSMFCALTKLGAMEAEQPMTEMSKFMAMTYFTSLMTLSLCFD